LNIFENTPLWFASIPGVVLVLILIYELFWGKKTEGLLKKFGELRESRELRDQNKDERLKEEKFFQLVVDGRIIDCFWNAKSGRFYGKGKRKFKTDEVAEIVDASTISGLEAAVMEEIREREERLEELKTE
jgi:hypothetical protein